MEKYGAQQIISMNYQKTSHRRRGGRQRILCQSKDMVKSRKDPEILTAVRRQATGLKVAEKD